MIILSIVLPKAHRANKESPTLVEGLEMTARAAIGFVWLLGLANIFEHGRSIPERSHAKIGQVLVNALTGNLTKRTGLPESIPSKNERNKAKNCTPRNDESHQHLFRRFSPYLLLRRKNR